MCHLWRVRGCLEEVRGKRGLLRLLGGGWRLRQERCGIEIGDGNAVARGSERECGQLVKPLDSGAGLWI